MKDYFWPSYSDLMTALFFVMLVLYVLTFAKLKHDQKEFKLKAELYEKVLAMEKALASLDQDLFDFDKKNKRYKLKIDATFKSGSCDITDIPEKKLTQLKYAGRAIYTLISKLGVEDEKVNYLLVLEGNTARTQTNYLNIPNKGYRLSYCRALALNDFWADAGYDFRKLKNCEIMIAGSGYFGKSREIQESKNKRFTIQITGKIGELR